MCLFYDINFGGEMRMPARDSTYLSTWNDVASSGVNRSNETWCFYADANYRGAMVKFPPGTQWSDFRTFRYGNTNFNDKISSQRRC